jgi:hypothetical protein
MKDMAVEDTDKPGGKIRLALFASTVKTGGKK